MTSKMIAFTFRVSASLQVKIVCLPVVPGTIAFDGPGPGTFIMTHTVRKSLLFDPSGDHSGAGRIIIVYDPIYMYNDS